MKLIFTKSMSHHILIFALSILIYLLKFLFCHLTAHMDHKQTKCIVLGSFRQTKSKHSKVLSGNKNIGKQK